MFRSSKTFPSKRGIIGQWSRYTTRKRLTRPPCQKPADLYRHVLTTLSLLQLFVGEVRSRDRTTEILPKEEVNLNQAEFMSQDNSGGNWFKLPGYLPDGVLWTGQGSNG